MKKQIDYLTIYTGGYMGNSKGRKAKGMGKKERIGRNGEAGRKETENRGIGEIGRWQITRFGT